MKKHGYSLTELDQLVPYELDLYKEIIIQEVKEENDKIRSENAMRG